MAVGQPSKRVGGQADRCWAAAGCRNGARMSVQPDLSDAQVLALVVAAQVEEVALVPCTHDAAAGVRGHECGW